MAVPKFYEFFPCILRVLGDGKAYRLKDVTMKCADFWELSEEDRKQMLPSNRQTTLANRIAWAKTYLKKAGLVDSPRRGFVVLTPAGKAVLEENPEKVTLPTPKVVLVDGERLANLMIEYNLGVTTTQTYEVKRVDYDFFNEDV